jgi:hypothetical protein
MNDYDFIQTKILQSCPHRSGHGRGGSALELEAEPSIPADDQEVELGASMCSPEEAFLRSRAVSARRWSVRSIMGRMDRIGLVGRKLPSRAPIPKHPS